jgi:hypothetical protein
MIVTELIFHETNAFSTVLKIIPVGFAVHHENPTEGLIA